MNTRQIMTQELIVECERLEGDAAMLLKSAEYLRGMAACNKPKDQREAWLEHLELQAQGVMLHVKRLRLFI